MYQLILAFAVLLPAVQPDPHHELLDKMTGHWVLSGTIAKQQTTHDVEAVWILEKGYVQIREVSREKTADGKPQYEALIHVVWDPKAGEYAVLWLDTTGVANFPPEGIGHARPARDAMKFIFKDPNGGVETTFVYDRAKDQWTWDIDNESKGKLTPFARVTLTRK
jgi:hypothetical protein